MGRAEHCPNPCVLGSGISEPLSSVSKERTGIPFSDRLSALVEERESQVVLGLDPDPSKLWPEAVARAGLVEAQPGERIQIAASKAPKFSAGADF